ncbi:MAG TPA: UPF0182 family protein [Acidimicrobiales bacterium]
MRAPSDLGVPRPPRRRGRARWWLIGIAVVLLILLVSLRSLANIYTDGLWFSSVNFGNVFSTLLVTKLGLFGVFGAIFFVVLWINLVVCDRLAGTPADLGQEDELVRRYQQIVRPYSGRVYVVLSFLLALIAASGTIGEWQNWILFRHGGNFGIKDAQFHKDIGFYIFKLPFMSFVVDWTLAILIVILAISTVFHYLNGGIVPQRGLPRVRPAVKAHLSVLLALIALTKAAGYVLQRWSLVNAQDGYVNGAGYTDVHARLPAQELLIYISIAAALILLYNIRQQGWTLPVLAVGIWAFVALVVGVIYPALLQTLKVNPAQSALEAPYIQRNITATRTAYGLNDVHQHSYSANTSPTPATATQATATLNNIRLWDPDPSISLQAFQVQQQFRNYYTFPSVAVDRYTVDGLLTPVDIGVREISTPNLPASSWVNTHLQYTHGYGAVLAPANAETNNSPSYEVGSVPPVSSGGLPKITQPDVYFGLGQSGYVVADTKQAEVDYQKPAPNNTNVESHYNGPGATGGVQLTSFLKRAAFALRLGDFNLLISDQITSKSRIMFVRDPVAMAQKAAPFLSFDADPYAVIDNGQIDWVVDGYTTTNQYPYSQNADTQQVPVTNGLPGSYNYVRNSVKVVINAYSGKMTFYDVDPDDPILQAYESAFPHMFTPRSKMSPTLQAHLRYPEDIFSIQSAIYGRYHLTNPANFYAASGAWQLSPTAGAGPSSQALHIVSTYNSQGELVSSNPARMAPVYQVSALPGSTKQSFTETEAFVSAAQSNTTNAQNLNLSAYMIASSDPGSYGQLNVYETPTGTAGPANADQYISSNHMVSMEITQLDQHGSEVLFGNTLMVPVGQTMLYLRPMYVSPTTNPNPSLQYVVGVVGTNVYFEQSLSKVLSDAFGISLPTGSSPSSSPSPTSGTSGGTVSTAVQNDLAAAQTDYMNAQQALSNGNLGQYQTDIAAMETEITAAQSGAAPAGTSTTTGSGVKSTTGTTTPPKHKATTTTTSKSKSSTKTTAASSTQPRSSTTTTTTSSAAPSG